MTTKITTANKIYEFRNRSIFNYYYLICGRLINDENSKFRPFKFVLYFDTNDVGEHANKLPKYVDKKDISNYIDYITSEFFGMINSYDDCTKFFNICKRTIDDYELNVKPYIALDALYS